MSLLEFQNVSLFNDGKTILDNISADIGAGDFIAVIGPSGSGKSTFLKLCAHLISPTCGNILYQGKNIIEYSPTELRRKIAYCFQIPYLFGDSVMDNLNFPFYIRNINPDTERINKLFSMFNMSTDLLSKDVNNLSGGEKQRLSLIRTLICKPEVLLLDEITSALDEDNTRLVEDIITSLNEEGVTILWITHNLEQGRRHANKALTIEAGKISSLEVLK